MSGPFALLPVNATIPEHCFSRQQPGKTSGFLHTTSFAWGGFSCSVTGSNEPFGCPIRPANVFARDCYTKAVNVPFVKVTGFGESAVVEPMANFIASVQETVDVSKPVVVVQTPLSPSPLLPSSTCFAAVF